MPSQPDEIALETRSAPEAELMLRVLAKDEPNAPHDEDPPLFLQFARLRAWLSEWSSAAHFAADKIDRHDLGASQLVDLLHTLGHDLARTASHAQETGQLMLGAMRVFPWRDDDADLEGGDLSDGPEVGPDDADEGEGDSERGDTDAADHSDVPEGTRSSEPASAPPAPVEDAASRPGADA